MKIKFLREFGGRETKEIHYPPGMTIELEDEDVALNLIERGVCESAEPVDPAKPPEAVVYKHGKKVQR